VASKLNEATFLRRFLERASKEGYTYYVMEAFDQPWKQDTEGAVGAYWGVYDVDRQPKFEFSAPIVMIPEWYYLAIISSLIAALTFSVLLVDGQSLLTRARGFLALIAYMAATAFVWVIYEYSHQYLSVITIVIGVLLIIGMLGVIVVLLIEAHEWAEALWTGKRRRPFVPIPVPDKDLKKVSIHLPIYNEPADMVIATLNAMSVLDYPDYEVIVVDNNTKDPAVWKPVEQHCSHLGSRFSFYHLQDWPGYKAGALNFALEKTSSDAEIIAVVDSDYQVDPNWLRDLSPQFSNEKIAIVQAPQDYRDNAMSAFKSMCYNEYRGFFFIGMVTRNERNAIIQHGTMTMIRKKVLEEVDGWGEWCITEDAELGLKIFEAGYEATYIAKSYGKGLTPDTFIDYKKQRFRWAYGAMQIIKRHVRALLGREKTSLSKGQRYHFLAGWLPWIADSVNLIFTFIALFWTVIMIMSPDQVDPPLVMFTLLPITLFFFKVAKILYLYRGIRVVGSTLQVLSATLAGLALSHTIAKAMLLGIVKDHIPFFRTPKKVHTNTILKALSSAREEALLMVALWLALYSLTLRDDAGTLDLKLWIALLGIQSIPYIAAVLVSVISAIPERAQSSV
jgi:cellulose synthase/poly-beta-1,6-N-acetylglucosamine synthase-like glycosyltransferase